MPSFSTILKIFQFRKKNLLARIMSTFENQTKIVAVTLKRRAEHLKKHSVYIICIHVLKPIFLSNRMRL